MAKFQCHSMKRHRPTSPSPSPVLENDDLLAEFLLRLPPQPSTLPRVGLVCKRWRRVVTDPQFVRRFRAFHRRTPPLHGFIMRSGLFFPTQAPPDRLPPSRFWRDRWCGEPNFQYSWGVHCCRHGLVLCCRGDPEFSSEFLVVDPVTGHRGRRIGVLHHEGALLMASAVVSAAGGADRRAFLVVALFAHDYYDIDTKMRLTASVYSSDSGAWAASSDAAVFSPFSIPTVQPSSLVGNAVYWFLVDDGEIVRFDLGTRRLSIIEQRPRPPDVPPRAVQQVRVPWITLDSRSWILPPAAAGDDGDRFCLAVLGRRSIEFWEREAELSDSDAAAKWVLCRTVQLDKVLPAELVEENVQMLPLRIGISGFDEESNVIFLWTSDGIFMSHIESMRFKKVLGRRIGGYLYNYSSV